MEGNEGHIDTVLCNNRIRYRFSKGCSREAFKANLISDDEWMDMLKVRNELAHDYDSEIVKTYCNTIVKEYIASQPDHILSIL